MKRRKLLVFSTSNVDDLEDFFWCWRKISEFTKPHFESIKTQTIQLIVLRWFPQERPVDLRVVQVNGYQTEKSVISFQNWSQPLGAPDFWVRPWSMWATIPPQFHSRSQTGRQRQWERMKYSNQFLMHSNFAICLLLYVGPIRAFMVGAQEDLGQHHQH